jgi:hypothetical protein
MTSFARALRAAALAAAVALAAAPAVAQIAPDGPPDVQAARTLRQIVDSYMDWRGGYAFAALQTIHERLYLDSGGGRQSGALWMDRDGRVRRETVMDGARQVEVATPQGAWREGADGAAAGDPAAVERARRYALLVFGDALSGRGGASVALAGTSEVEDKTWSVVRVSFGDADTYDVLIDAATGYLCCYQITEGGVKRTELMGDWRLVDGVRMPFATLTSAAAEVGARISAIELNRPLDAALFQRPGGG